MKTFAGVVASSGAVYFNLQSSCNLLIGGPFELKRKLFRSTFPVVLFRKVGQQLFVMISDV